MLSHTRMIIAVLAVSVFGFCATTASADSNGLTVSNPSDSACSLSGYGGVYTGGSSVILDSSGVKMYRCSGSLVSGTAVAQTTKLHQDGCMWLFTPGGIASVTCPRGF